MQKQRKTAPPPAATNKPSRLSEAAAPLSERDQDVIDAAMSRAAEEGEDAPRDRERNDLSDRAGEIGLTDRMIRDIQLAGTRPAVRTCLACEDRFVSSGAHNRLCRRCR